MVCSTFFNFFSAKLHISIGAPRFQSAKSEMTSFSMMSVNVYPNEAGSDLVETWPKTVRNCRVPAKGPV